MFQMRFLGMSYKGFYSYSFAVAQCCTCMVFLFYRIWCYHSSTLPSKVHLSLKHYDVLIVGAGLSGAVLAERHALIGHRVLVIDKRPHIAGNCYDYIDEPSQLRISKYGAHAFHTNNDRVWHYVNKFGVWTPWELRVAAFVDGKYVPLPVNIHSVNMLFGLRINSSEQMDVWLKSVQVRPPGGVPRNSEEMALSRFGHVLYDKIFGPYTLKQWNISAAALDPIVTGRVPIWNNFEGRYFRDKYQALPRDGFTALVQNMLSNPLITTKLNVDYFDLPKTKITTYYTGPIDRFFGKEGLLEYRSLRFERLNYDNVEGTVLPKAIVTYPSLEFPYTRDVEYKHFLNQKSTRSVVFREYPAADGEPYYPVPRQRNRELYEQLISRTNKFNVTFVGRLANYKYFNMDEAIANALKVFQLKHVVHIVTTNFRENIIAWTSKLCRMLPGQALGWFIYLKDPLKSVDAVQRQLEVHLKGGCNTISVTVVDHRQNLGRETLAWLDYMMNDFNLAAYNVFVQGYPEVLLETIVESIKLRPKFKPFHEAHCESTNTTSFVQPFFERNFRELVIDTLKMPTICVSRRGEFAASGYAIMKMVKKRRELLVNKIIPMLQESNNPPIGHVMERLWFEWFN